MRNFLWKKVNSQSIWGGGGEGWGDMKLIFVTHYWGVKLIFVAHYYVLDYLV